MEGSLHCFLSLQGNLNRHFGLRYFALEKVGEATNTLALDPEEGKRVLAGLIRVDFVDAQRSLDDQEASRSNRLSTAFETFYRKNLTQAEASEEKYAVRRASRRSGSCGQEKYSACCVAGNNVRPSSGTAAISA